MRRFLALGLALLALSFGAPSGLAPASAVPISWGIASGFTPVTHTYTTGTSATETIPVGASSLIIEDCGSGGGGGTQNSPNFGAGAGSGAYVKKTVSVAGASGRTLTYTVGAVGTGATIPGAGTNATASTVVNATFLTSVSLSAGGGTGGNISGVSPGAGGTPTGGDTNTAGNPGNSSGTGGGLGIVGTNCTTGTGGHGGQQPGFGGDGGGATIVFAYT